MPTGNIQYCGESSPQNPTSRNLAIQRLDSSPQLVSTWPPRFVYILLVSKLGRNSCSIDHENSRQLCQSSGHLFHHKIDQKTNKLTQSALFCNFGNMKTKLSRGMLCGTQDVSTCALATAQSSSMHEVFVLRTGKVRGARQLLGPLVDDVTLMFTLLYGLSVPPCPPRTCVPRFSVPSILCPFTASLRFTKMFKIRN